MEKKKPPFSWVNYLLNFLIREAHFHLPPDPPNLRSPISGPTPKNQFGFPLFLKGQKQQGRGSWKKASNRNPPSRYPTLRLLSDDLSLLRMDVRLKEGMGGMFAIKFAYFTYGCFLKWWYQTTIGFPTKNDHFGVFWGSHHFLKHPYSFAWKNTYGMTWPDVV